jgi:F-type H+-transporting ATPase subunit b
MISAAHAATAAGGAAPAFWQTPEFWVALAFVVMVGAAFRPIARAVASALDIRAEKIRTRIEDAQKLQEDAKEMLATYQRKSRDALKEAEAILDHAKAEAKRLAEQAARDLDESIKRREQQAKDRIAQAEAQAVKEVRHLAVDVAVAAAEQVLRDNLSAAQAKALIDQAIKDVGAKLH